MFTYYQVASFTTLKRAGPSTSSSVYWLAKVLRHRSLADVSVTHFYPLSPPGYCNTFLSLDRDEWLRLYSQSTLTCVPLSQLWKLLSVSLCLSLYIFVTNLLYFYISLSLSVRFRMESFYHFCYISLYPKSLFSYLPCLLFQFTLYISFFSLFPNLSLYVSFLPLPFATLGTLLRLFFSSVSFCNVYHIQCLLIFSLPVFVKKCSNWLCSNFGNFILEPNLSFFSSFFHSFKATQLGRYLGTTFLFCRTHLSS